MELLSNSGIVSIECVKHVALINDYEINLMPSSRQLIQIYSFQYIDSIKKKGQPTADLLLYSKLINGGHKNYIGWFNIMVPSHLLQHQSQQLSTRLKDTFTHTIAKRLQKLLTDTAKYLVVFFLHISMCAC